MAAECVARLTLEEREAGVWDQKFCVPKMARSDFSLLNVVFPNYHHFGLEGGGGSRGGGGTPPMVVSRSNVGLSLTYLTYLAYYAIGTCELCLGEGGRGLSRNAKLVMGHPHEQQVNLSASCLLPELLPVNT